MLSLAIEDFMIELKDGSVKNVGGPTKSATVKLYDVSTAEAREFGDERVKFAFADDDGNAVEVAVDPDDARSVVRDIESIEDEGVVFE